MNPINKKIFPDEIDVRNMGEHQGNSYFKTLTFFRVCTSLGWVTVPIGFVTDGASIPRLFWGILHPYGSYFPAALLHDYLYSPRSDSYKFTRKQADLLFFEAMFNLGVPWHWRHIMYKAVRRFGGFSYKKLKTDFDKINAHEED
jgi:hypothetical protein